MTPVDLAAEREVRVELSQSVTGALAGVVVDGAGEPVPEARVIARPEWSGLGFPSGHVSVAFALATVGTLYLPGRWRWVPFGLAVLTSVMRMYTAAHLPLDVVGGIGLGVATGGVANLFLELDRSRR